MLLPSFNRSSYKSLAVNRVFFSVAQTYIYIYIYMCVCLCACVRACVRACVFSIGIGYVRALLTWPYLMLNFNTYMG